MEEEIKKYIQSYRELKAKKEILEKIMQVEQKDSKHEEYKVLEIKIQIIVSCLQILEKNEREIVSWHLIERLKWNEIAVMCQEQSGAMPDYSERTLKRIQKNALQKIEYFISENKWEEYMKNT